ncbi:unnamed protein product, partial [Mesorhabditis spiculigera]
MTAPVTKRPATKWAQRRTHLFITFEVDSAEDVKLDATPTTLHFSAANGAEKYDVELEFFEQIDPESVQRSQGTRFVEITVIKKEEKWWPRLQKSSAKCHWLATDYSKWKDEDEVSEEEGEEPMMPGGGGMPGMPGGFDLAKYMQQAGAGGLGGMGGADFDGLGDDDDEDGMPDLEDADEDDDQKPGTAASHA